MPRRPLVSFLAIVSLCVASASAQEELSPGDRPGDRPLLTPPLEEPVPEAPQLVLPPLPESEGPPAPSTGLRFEIREIRFTSNTVFSDAQLAGVAAPWLLRKLGSLDLHELRDAITAFYVDRGYVNSGATIPDQQLQNGALEIVIVEGRLTAVEVDGNEHFRDAYFVDRLELGDAVLNVRELERRLQILQRDPRIRSVRAHLRPGVTRGEALLRVAVTENRPYRLTVGTSNYQSPSLGDVRGTAFAEYGSVTGGGDRFRVDYAGAEGLQDVEGRYDIPVTPWDTLLQLRYRYSEREVVEAPFDVLDLESESMTAAVALTQPVWRTPDWEVEVGATGEWRQSINRFFGGRRIDLTEGSENGKAVVSVVRVHQQATYRDSRQAFAIRSTTSLGIDALDSTVHSGPREDSDFLSWIGQAQYFRRFAPWPWEVVGLTLDYAFDNPSANGDGVDWKLLDPLGSVIASGAQDGDSVSVAGTAIADLDSGESLWLVLGNCAGDDPVSDQTFVHWSLAATEKPPATLDFDATASGTFLNTSTSLSESGFDYTQTLFIGGVDGSPEFVDDGGGDIGVEDSIPDDFFGQTVEFTRVGGGTFRFDSIDARTSSPASLRTRSRSTATWAERAARSSGRTSSTRPTRPSGSMPRTCSGRRSTRCTSRTSRGRVATRWATASTPGSA